VRLTPLEVGKKYVYDRYFRKEKNPVTIEVVKRERMEIPGARRSTAWCFTRSSTPRGCSPAVPIPASG